MAEQRLRQRREHARRGVRGAGSEQQARRDSRWWPWRRNSTFRAVKRWLVVAAALALAALAFVLVLRREPPAGGPPIEQIDDASRAAACDARCCARRPKQ